MRITDILKGGLTAILNEAPEIKSKKPRRKFSNDDIAAAQEKYKAADKEQQDKKTLKKPEAFNKADPGQNSAAKGKYQKPGTDSKRAGGMQQKDQQQSGGVTQLASDGKGKGQEGGKAMAAAKRDQKVKKGEEKSAIDQRQDDDKEKQSKKGALSSTGNFGNSGAESDNAAAQAQQRRLDTIGTEDYEEHDFGPDSKPKFSNDNRDVAHGLDAAQQGDGHATTGSAGTLSKRQAPGAGGEDIAGQEAWDEKEAAQPGDQLPPHDPDRVDELLASNDQIQRNIAQKMKDANDEWYAAQAAADSAKGRRASLDDTGRYDRGAYQGVTAAGREAQEKHKAQKKAAKDELKSVDELSLDTQNAMASKKRRDDANDATRAGLTGADHARAAASGLQRGSLEVDQRKAQANQDLVKQGIKPGEETPGERGSRITGLAQKAQAGDQEATKAIFKNVAPMLMQVASKYAFGNQDKQADLYGEAKVALMTAIKTFDPERGAEFNTHLMNTLKGMVRDASYQDRGDIQVSKDTQKSLGEYQKLQKKWADQGLTGYAADKQIMVDMGLAKDPENIPDAAWAKLDKLKQAGVAGANVSMHGTGEEGSQDADSAEGVGSEYTGDDAIAGGGSAEDDIESISKQLATQSPEAIKGKFDELISMAGLGDEEADIVQLAFGIGGDEPMSDDEIQMSTGFSSTKQRSITDEALYKMAAYIAQENGTDTDEEHLNLKKIYKYRGKNFKDANLGRNVGDYNPDETRDEQQARYDAKSNQKKAKQQEKDWEAKQKQERSDERDDNTDDAKHDKKAMAAKQKQRKADRKAAKK